MAWRDIGPEQAETIGKLIYEEEVRPTLKGAAEPIGHFLVVDFHSRDWELDEKLHKAARRLRERKPHADVYGFRVGFPAAFESLSP